MPRLPGPEALGNLPSLRSGADAARITGADPIAEGVGRIGRAMVTVGHEQQAKDESYEVERRILEFNRNEERTLEDNRRTMEPGGTGFADNFRTGYDTRARELFGRARQDGLSQTALQRLDVGLLRAGEGLQTRAFRHQRDEEDRFNRDEVTTRLNGIISDTAGRTDLIDRAPEYLERGRREAEALIGTSRLSAADRYTVRRTFQREFERAVIDSMVSGADTPERREEVRRQLLGSRRLAQPPGRRDRSGQDFAPPGEGVTPPPTTTGPAPDPLLDFLRRVEGFRGTAYSDHRQTSIGYGTRARPGETTITREEAERRLVEEVGNARNAVRARFPNLTPGQEMALTDLTYNSGTRWMDSGLGEAVRSGNWQTAEAAFRLYVNASGQPLEALRNRRNELAGLLAPGAQLPSAWATTTTTAGPGGPPPPTTEPPPTTPPPPPTGRVEEGRGVNLDNIVFVRAPDGAPTRVRTYVLESEGRYFLLPGFDDDGRRVTEAVARERFLRNGQHLGAFDTAEHANAYSRVLWEGPPRTTPPPTGGPGGLGAGPPGPGEQGPGTGGTGGAGTRRDRVRFEGEPPPTTEPPGEGIGGGEGSLFRAVRGGALTSAARRIDLMDRQVAREIDEELRSWERGAGEGRAPPVAEMLRIAQSLENIRDPVVLEHYQSVLRYARRTHELMRMRPAGMEMVIREERERQNREGASPVASRWLASWEKLLEHTNTQIRTNTVDWAQRLGIVDAGGVRFDSDDSMRAHAARVGMIDGALGRESPRIFTNGQRDEAVGILRQGGRPMLEMLGSMSRNWGPDFTRRAINEIATAEGRTGDAPELALIGQMYLNAQNNPALMPTVDDAAEAIRLRTTDANVRTAMGNLIPRPERRDAATSILGSTYLLNDSAHEATLAVTDLLYYRRANARDRATFNPTLYRRLLQEVAGQSTERNVTYGGIYYQGRGRTYPIEVPPNMRQDGVRTALEGLRTQDLIDEHGFGPVGSDGRYLTMDQIRRMTLVTASNGRYWIAQGDPTVPGAANWVHDGSGRPYELDLNRLQPILQQRVPEIYRGSIEAPRPRRLIEAFTPPSQREEGRSILMELPGAREVRDINPSLLYEFRRQFVAANPDAARRREIERNPALYGEELRRWIDATPGLRGRIPSAGAPPPPPPPLP